MEGSLVRSGDDEGTVQRILWYNDDVDHFSYITPTKRNK